MIFYANIVVISRVGAVHRRVMDWRRFIDFADCLIVATQILLLFGNSIRDSYLELFQFSCAFDNIVCSAIFASCSDDKSTSIAKRYANRRNAGSF